MLSTYSNDSMQGCIEFDLGFHFNHTFMENATGVNIKKVYPQ